MNWCLSNGYILMIKATYKGSGCWAFWPRIAICYFFAAVIIYHLKLRKAFYTGLVILLLYWVLCMLLGDKADPYSMKGWFGNDVDKAVLG